MGFIWIYTEMMARRRTTERNAALEIEKNETAAIKLKLSWRRYTKRQEKNIYCCDTPSSKGARAPPNL